MSQRRPRNRVANPADESNSMNPTSNKPIAKLRCQARRSRGLSLVELLIALAITAMLLTATMVALDASFKAYADSAEQASAQASTRMVTSRLLTLIRTSTAHGPLMPDAAATPPVTLSGDTLTSNYIELLDPSGNFVRIEYRSNTQELWVITTPPGGTATSYSIMGGVTAASFSCLRRMNDDGMYVLDRGTMDLTIMPGADATLAVEYRQGQAIRVFASTMPRKLQ